MNNEKTEINFTNKKSLNKLLKALNNIEQQNKNSLNTSNAITEHKPSKTDGDVITVCFGGDANAIYDKKKKLLQSTVYGNYSSCSLGLLSQNNGNFVTHYSGLRYSVSKKKNIKEAGMFFSQNFDKKNPECCCIWYSDNFVNIVQYTGKHEYIGSKISVATKKDVKYYDAFFNSINQRYGGITIDNMPNIIFNVVTKEQFNLFKKQINKDNNVNGSFNVLEFDGLDGEEPPVQKLLIGNEKANVIVNKDQGKELKIN